MEVATQWDRDTTLIGEARRRANTMESRMAYSGSECYTQIHNPTTYGMSKPQNAYGMAETWDGFGQSYGNYKSQNGPAMSKTQLHVPGNGYGKMQSYGYGNDSNHGKHEGRVYGYGSPTPADRFQKNGSGTGHGFDHHGNYESYEETNGYEEYAINEMVRSQPHRRGNHSGHGNGFITTQSYGPCKTMGLEYTEAEYSETHFSNDSHYYGGGRGYRGNGHSAKGLMNNNSGENSCSDSQSNDENDHHGGFNKVWKCKEIR